MPEKKESALLLSAEEKTWLDGHSVLKLGYDVDWPPIEQIEKARPSLWKAGLFI